MENRFGFKDLVMAGLLVILIVLVILSMVQYDRQWTEVQAIKTHLQENTRDLARVERSLSRTTNDPHESELQEELARIRQLLERGATLPAPMGNSKPPQTQPTSTPAEAEMGPWIGRDVDPFARIKAAQKLPGYTLGDANIDVFGVVPDKLTPLISSDAYSSEVQSSVLESLADRDPATLEWKPKIARAWRISKDGLRIEFEIRRGVVFSDGEPLTADDVVFTFNWIMNEQVEAPRERAYFEKVDRVEKLDPYRVAFVFKEPYFKAFELAGGMGIMAKHFYSQFTPTDFNRSTGLLLGTGPYRLADPRGWRPEPGKPIELIRNERYWGEPGPYNRLIWRVIENDTARLTTFINGEIDSFYPTPEQYQKLIKDQQLLARTTHYEIERPTSGYMYIGWNEEIEGKPTPFADKRVRRAMTLLTDRERICREIMLGYAKVASGPFSALTKQADPAIQPWPFDPAQAKALLEQAGYTARDGNGVLARGGAPLRFKLSFPSNSETIARIVSFIKDTFARAGVVVDADPLEWSILLKRIEQRQVEACLLGWGGVIEDDPYQIFHSSQIKGTGDNFVHYANPELDKLIEEARKIVDEDQRMPVWHRVHQILHDDQPYTFLLNRKSLVFLDGRFKNIQQVKLGLNPSLEWYVPRNAWKWEKGE